MTNKVILIGNVGKDPEIKTMNNGKKYAKFNLATNKSWKSKESAERKTHTEWHRIVVFNDGLIGVIEQYVKSGSKLYIEGEIVTRSWEDKEGIKKYTTEINLRGFGCQLLLLDRKEDSGSNYGQPPEETYEEDENAW